VNEELEQIRRAFRDVVSCRIGTVREDGGPYVATRWFVWLEDDVWVATRVGDGTWVHAARDPRVSIVIDRGREWADLSGVRVEGVAEGFPAEHPDLRAPMSAWHEKYRTLLGGDSFERLTTDVQELGFLRVAPARMDTWDHR
jgi:Pyridoxamine 5'-phosphate oxidase